MSTVTIGLGQFTAKTDLEHNLQQIEGLVRDAGEKGVEVLCLHELSTTIYFCFKNVPEFRSLAEAEDGFAVSRIRNAAAAAGVGLIFPFYEQAPDGKLFNTALVLDKDGNTLGKYRKMSIPAIQRTVDAHEMPSDEQYYFSPGDLGFPVFELGFHPRRHPDLL